ncbi:PqiC family protein [Lichenicoccus sp.]|uniref:PqiC family protein n=1 Tax=Lichenicoccus sp. TaxID=2781899 RepID=UPI003D1467FC
MRGCRFLLLAGCLAAWLAGCAPPAPRIYVLAPPASAAPASEGATVLQVPRIRIPDYLDTRDIQVRGAGSVLAASRTGRWASRLSDQLTDTLVADLQRLHPELQVTRSELAAAGAQRLLVDLDVLELDRDGTATARASWSIVRPGRPDLVMQSHLSLHGNGADDAGVLNTLRRVASQLAGRISLPAG